jgi:hypothetical protein
MKKSVAVEESILVVPEFDIDSMKVPVTVVVNTPKLEREYRRLSNKLGTAFAETLSTLDLTKYLSENSMTIYPMDKVKKYLDQKAAELPKTKTRDGWGSSRTVRWTWNWLALREQDITKKSGNFSKLYGTKAIPPEVLMTIEKIVDELGPTRVNFYVSDFVKASRPTPKPVDPFLAVCAANTNSKLFVIERWDEPSFRS